LKSLFKEKNEIEIGRGEYIGESEKEENEVR
jgi:hypothetical protein